MISVALIAVKMRKAHGLRPAATFQLTVAAGSVWPLLVIATLQIFALATFANGLDAVHALSSRALQPAVDPPPVDLTVAA